MQERWCILVGNTHVLLKEFYVDREVPYFIDYIKKYTDMPFLIKIDEESGEYKSGRLLRANELKEFKDIENGDWKFIQIDEDSKSFVVPKGTVGHRWSKEKSGEWNTKLENSIDNRPYNPKLSLIDDSDAVLNVTFEEFGLDVKAKRGVPVKYVTTTDGKKVAVATIFDVMMAHYGVPRGLSGDYPEDYNDKKSAYTPAWQEIFTGIDSKTIIQIAREWGHNGEVTQGKNMVIVGAGVNHWYHCNLMYRSAIMALMFTGSIGRNGGGMNHYVGQEKLAPVDSWGNITFARIGTQLQDFNKHQSGTT